MPSRKMSKYSPGRQGVFQVTIDFKMAYRILSQPPYHIHRFPAAGGTYLLLDPLHKLCWPPAFKLELQESLFWAQPQTLYRVRKHGHIVSPGWGLKICFSINYQVRSMLLGPNSKCGQRLRTVASPWGLARNAVFLAPLPPTEAESLRWGQISVF